MNGDDLAKEIAESRVIAAKEGERAFALSLLLEEADEIVAALRTPDRDAMWQALEEVRACMLNGGDGAEGDFGWNISRLTKARPMIRAALSASRPVREGWTEAMRDALAEREREVREACAKVVDAIPATAGGTYAKAFTQAAQAIRESGK